MPIQRADIRQSVHFTVNEIPVAGRIFYHREDWEKDWFEAVLLMIVGDNGATKPDFTVEVKKQP